MLTEKENRSKAIDILKINPKYQNIDNKTIVRSFCPDRKLNLSTTRNCKGGPSSLDICEKCWEEAKEGIK